MSINSINSVNSIDTNIYKSAAIVENKNAYADECIYNSAPLNYDTFESTAKSEDCGGDLRNEFEKTKEEQGLIGKAWDGIKNFFHMKNGSNNIEKMLQQYESGQISKEDAKAALENYQNGQKMCVDIVGDITSGIVAVGAAAFAPVTGGASLLVAAGAGAAVKTAIKASDATFNGREYDLKDFGYDLITGSLNGAMGPLSNGIGGAVGTGVAKALGLEAVETTAKAAGKGILAKLLAKGGTTYVAKEGVNLGFKTVGAKVLAYGADMAIDGALSGATDGFSRAVGEGRGEDIGKDTLNGAFGGLIAAPVIGGSMKLAFKGASSVSSRVFNNTKDTVSNTLSENIGEDLTSKSIESAKKYLKNSSNPDAVTLLKAINENTELTQKELLKKLQSAINVIDDPVSEKTLKNIAQNLSEQYADNASMTRTINELFGALGIDSDVIYDAKNSVYKSSSEYGNFSARPKSEKSVFSKLKSKILGFKADVPDSSDAARRLIGDAHGTRIVIKDAGLEASRIEDLIKKSISEPADQDMFLDYFLKGTGEIPNGKKDVFRALEKQICDEAREVQSGQFVKKLARAIINDEINVTELHNYTGKDGISYFSKTQVDSIKEAYDEWFKKMYKSAANDADSSRFKIVVIDNVEHLKDKSGNVFKPHMLIEDISNTKKAIKDSGYTAAQMNIITKEGVMEELQYRGTHVDTIAESEHIPYDIRKGKTTVLRKEYDKIRGIFDKFKDNSDFAKKYNRYTDDTYIAYRKKELGFSASIPDIKDYLGDMLSADEMDTVSIEGLNRLHTLIKEIDKAKQD